MKNILPALIFLVIVLAIDLYAFRSLRLLSVDWQKPIFRQTVIVMYAISSLIAYALIFYAYSTFTRDSDQKMNYYVFFMGFGILVLILVPKLVVALFQIVDDLTHLFRHFVNMLSRPNGQEESTPLITRWQFITRLGWLAASIPFLGIAYGIIRGRYAFRVIETDLSFSNLPKSLDGLRIVHISDIHIGSFFNNHEAVEKGIEKVNSLNPDLILFTGDLVNNYASEIAGWEKILSKLQAKYGKYSVFGNHDYGDYVNWESQEAKAQNLKRLMKYHEEIGFQLLLDEWTPISINAEDHFELIGVQNWGAGGFAKYGDLSKALRGTDSTKFQLLLSHDPSHWDAQVLAKTQIDLTLSGHTHGMQFGVEIPGLVKWSPVKYRYPRWGGHYVENGQNLYVNRGFGYIGFPGRVGMAPEITLLTLHSA